MDVRHDQDENSIHTIDGMENAEEPLIERMHSTASVKWEILGSKIPRKEVVFFSQMIVIYTVIITCIVNLSLGTTGPSELWVILLSTSIGAVMPNPQMDDNSPYSQRKLLPKQHTTL